MIEHVGLGTPEHGLEITGMTHRLSAMHVGGERWIGMFSIESPSNGALLQPQDVLALRDWLNERLFQFRDVDRAEHDDAECRAAAKDGYLADLCRSCYVNHVGLRP